MIRQYVVGYAFPKEPGKPDMTAIGEAAQRMKPQVEVLDRAVARPAIWRAMPSPSPTSTFCRCCST